MEKLKKSYVEKRYKEKAEISEVMERDPMKIQNDGEICAFRFFDKEINANGEVLYENRCAEFRYDGQKEADILDFKKFTFGDNILDIEREEEEKMNAQIKEIREKINKEAQKEKYRLMKEELELIKPETKTVSNDDLSVGKK